MMDHVVEDHAAQNGGARFTEELTPSHEQGPAFGIGRIAGGRQSGSCLGAALVKDFQHLLAIGRFGWDEA